MKERQNSTHVVVIVRMLLYRNHITFHKIIDKEAQLFSLRKALSRYVISPSQSLTDTLYLLAM